MCVCGGECGFFVWWLSGFVWWLSVFSGQLVDMVSDCAVFPAPPPPQSAVLSRVMFPAPHLQLPCCVQLRLLCCAAMAYPLQVPLPAGLQAVALHAAVQYVDSSGTGHVVVSGGVDASWAPLNTTYDLHYDSGSQQWVWTRCVVVLRVGEWSHVMCEGAL